MRARLAVVESFTGSCGQACTTPAGVAGASARRRRCRTSMDWTPRALNWHSANDAFGRVKNGPHEYLRTLQGWKVPLLHNVNPFSGRPQNGSRLQFTLATGSLQRVVMRLLRRLEVAMGFHPFVPTRIRRLEALFGRLVTRPKLRISDSRRVPRIMNDQIPRFQEIRRASFVAGRQVHDWPGVTLLQMVRVHDFGNWAAKRLKIDRPSRCAPAGGKDEAGDGEVS